jgi:hypothetical protein
MAISGLVAGGVQTALDDVLDRRLKEALRQQQEQQAAAQLQLQRDQLAQQATNQGEMRDLQRRTIDLSELRRRDENNARGLELMQGDKQQMDADAILQRLPPNLRVIADLRKIGVNARPEDVETPEQREARLQGDEAREIRVRRASIAPRQPERDPVADYEAKLKLDAKYKTGQGAGPSPYSQERATRTIQSVDELMGKVNRWTTGMGSLLANIPETDATDFASELDTLKANIAFNELTAMREASKTGGALGAVSDAEMRLLQSALGSLNPRQSPENIKAQLQKIKESVHRWQEAGGQPAMKPMSSRDAASDASGGPRRLRFDRNGKPIP